MLKVLGLWFLLKKSNPVFQYTHSKMDTVIKKQLGIIITCYKGDYFLTKGLLASIKMFMPEVPICIIQDGNFSIKELLSVYNVTHIIKKENVKNDFLRNNCFGSRCTNLIAFFESPFEYFLYLDSDLVLWGNILKNIPFNINEIDFLHNEPHEAYTSKVYKEQYFDYTQIFNYTEYFDWKVCNLFNSGVFFSKKNIFEKTEFEEIIKLWKINRELLPTDPQSILNVLVFRNKLKDKLKVEECHLQTVVPVKTLDELNSRFTILKNLPNILENTIIHWAGPKPRIFNKNKVFIEPMLYFRTMHLDYTKSFWRHFPTFYFYLEEIRALYFIYYSKAKRKIGI